MRHRERLLDYAAHSDPGRHRAENEDSGYAGPRICAVADGMGGHPHGDVASAVAITALAGLDAALRADADPAAGRALDPVATLRAAVADIKSRLDAIGASATDFAGMGTTLDALLWDGTEFTLAHIGDSRAYLARDGELHRISRDHSLVQLLVEQGRLTPEEAESHPRGSMILRSLQSGGDDPSPDIARVETRPGDRFLLCSDGLTRVVSEELIREALTTVRSPEAAARGLVDLANQSGGPDNITCVIADVPADEKPRGARDSAKPVAVGAAARPSEPALLDQAETCGVGSTTTEAAGTARARRLFGRLTRRGNDASR
jgi:protein phosphatase